MLETEERVKESGERETKKHDFGTIFSFSNFSSFRKLRNRFWYQFKQMFPMNH